MTYAAPPSVEPVMSQGLRGTIPTQETDQGGVHPINFTSSG